MQYPLALACSLTFDLGLRCTFRWVFIWVFITADVSKEILHVGANFLKHYGLSVNVHCMRSQCLSDSLTHLRVQSFTSFVTSSIVLSLLPLHVVCKTQIGLCKNFNGLSSNGPFRFILWNAVPTP